MARLACTSTISACAILVFAKSFTVHVVLSVRTFTENNWFTWWICCHLASPKTHIDPCMGHHLSWQTFVHCALLPADDIDLSFVDKQTALVGTVGRMLVKHKIVKTDVLTKFNIFCKLSTKQNTSHNKLVVLLNKIKKCGLHCCPKSDLFLPCTNGFP